MIVKEDYKMGGEEWTIVDKINLLTVDELKSFLSHCARTKNFPDLTVYANWIRYNKRVDKLATVSDWIIDNKLHGDLTELFKLVTSLIRDIKNSDESSMFEWYPIAEWFDEFTGTKEYTLREQRSIRSENIRKEFD